MKYEKATAEIVNFDDHELFAVLSSGKECDSFYSIKATNGNNYLCFNVFADYGLENPGNHSVPITCYDITLGGMQQGYGLQLICIQIDHYYVVP